MKVLRDEVLILELYRKTYANVYLDNIKYNVETVINHFKNYDYYFGVVKSDCYGHKGIETVEAIISGGVNYLAVVTLEEALYIRKYLKEIPILCLGVINSKDVEIAKTNNITIIINSLETLYDYLKINTEGLKVHIKINTGANRLGLKTKEEITEALIKLAETNIEVEGIYTHIYKTEDKKTTEEQFKLFQELTKNIDLDKIPIRHIQASDALYGYEKPKYINACRLGIIMYGLIENDLNLKSTISLHSEIAQIYHLKKGENVGYAGIYHAPNDEIVAVVSIGYADGIIRRNSGRNVYINNKAYPIIGNICMDYLFIRIDENVKLNDEVIIIKDNDHINEIAKHLETISYEIITSIGSRVPRIYKE